MPAQLLGRPTDLTRARASPQACLRSLRAVGLGSGIACGASALCSPPSAAAHSSSGARLAGLDQRVTALEQQQRSRPVVVCGPSGVGKGTLLTRLMGEFPEQFGFSVSHTTRTPRAGEVDGVHYHFTPKPEMEAMIARGEFIEHARVHANLYGTSISAVRAVRDAGKTCLLDIDVQGADSVKKTDLGARFVFIAPPKLEDLEKRLRGRGTETAESLGLRLTNARTEMAYLEKPGYWETVIVNDDVEVAYEKLKAALQAGEGS